MIACIDIGGSSIKVAIEKEGQLIEKENLPIGETFESFIDEIVNWIASKKDIEGVAISAPGAVDVNTGIIGGSSALPYIHGPNFKEIFKEKLGLDISIENDANCAALGEVYKGAAIGHKDVCFMVVGSGIGGAIVKDGVIHHGPHLHGGEFGYTLVPTLEGGAATLSDTASTRSLVERVSDKLEGEWNGLKVFEEAQKGNKVCIDSIEQFYHYLALGIYNIQYTYDPELFVIGGAISKREDLCENIYRHIDRILEEVKIAKIRPTVVPCQYFGDANLIGASVYYHMLYD